MKKIAVVICMLIAACTVVKAQQPEFVHKLSATYTSSGHYAEVFIPDDPSQFTAIIDMVSEPQKDTDGISEVYFGHSELAINYFIEIPVTFSWRNDNGDDVFVYLKERNILIGFQYDDIYIYHQDGSIERRQGRWGERSLCVSSFKSNPNQYKLALTLLDYSFSKPEDASALRQTKDFKAPLILTPGKSSDIIRN